MGFFSERDIFVVAVCAFTQRFDYHVYVLRSQNTYAPFKTGEIHIKEQCKYICFVMQPSSLYNINRYVLFLYHKQ